MSKELKVRSKRRREVDEDKLALAFTILATIMVEEEDARSVPSPALAMPRVSADGLPPSMGQIYHEAVEALKASGMSNADAIRKVAREHDRGEMTIRSGIHSYKRRYLEEPAA